MTDDKDKRIEGTKTYDDLPSISAIKDKIIDDENAGIILFQTIDNTAKEYKASFSELIDIFLDRIISSPTLSSKIHQDVSILDNSIKARLSNPELIMSLIDPERSEISIEKLANKKFRTKYKEDVLLQKLLELIKYSSIEEGQLVVKPNFVVKATQEPEDNTNLEVAIVNLNNKLDKELLFVHSRIEDSRENSKQEIEYIAKCSSKGSLTSSAIVKMVNPTRSNIIVNRCGTEGITINIVPETILDLIHFEDCEVKILDNKITVKPYFEIINKYADDKIKDLKQEMVNTVKKMNSRIEELEKIVLGIPKD